jgi:hypothetical protein
VKRTWIGLFRAVCAVPSCASKQYMRLTFEIDGSRGCRGVAWDHTCFTVLT